MTWGFGSRLAPSNRSFVLHRLPWAPGGEEEDLLVILLDIDKAFDTLWGQGLVVKLHRLGIRGRMLKWVDSYMRGRTCRATVRGALAEPKEWDLGIGQGGILGPLFFIIYCADMPVPTTEGGKYADDVALWKRIARDNASRRSENIKHVQGLLDSIFEWGRTWRLTFSPTKTQVIVLTPSRRREAMLENPVTLTLGGQALEQVTSGGARYLGVWLDPHLQFNVHINKLVEKGWRRVQVLRSIAGSKWGADRWSLTRMYEGWVRPVLEYGNVIYSGASQRLLGQLDKVQAAALRAILGATPTADIEAMHWETGIQPLGIRRLRDAAAMDSTLRRSRDDANMACADYANWLESRSATDSPNRISKSLDIRGYIRIGGRMSPFEFLDGASNLLEIRRWDPFVEKRDAVAGGFCKPPWALKPTPRCPRWPTLGSASTRTKQQQAVARQYGEAKIESALLSGGEDDVQVIFIFTDGSADLAMGGGGASSVWVGLDNSPSRIDTIEVGHLATNYSAETTALLLAISGIEEAVGPDPAGYRVHIFSDCQPALRLVEDGVVGQSKSYWEVAHRGRLMLDYLRGHGYDVRLDWIPAHCGLVHNEIADRAAAKAAADSRAHSTVGEAIPRPHALIKGAIRRSVNALLLEWYTATEKAKRVRKLSPHAPPADLLSAFAEADLGRTAESCISRLRIGNETRPNGRIRMGLATTTDCPHCGLEDGTEHRLFCCPRYRQARIKARNRLKHICENYIFNFDCIVGLAGVQKKDRPEVLKVVAKLLVEDSRLGDEFLETRRKPATAGVGEPP